MIDVPAASVLVASLCLAVVSLIGTGLIRRRVRRGANAGARADALELAYVNGGPRLVLFTCLAELARRGLVQSAPLWRGGGIERIEGPDLPADAPPLLAAVLEALPEYDRVPDLLADDQVAAGVQKIGIRLVRRGWFLSERTQKRVRRWAPGWFAAIGCLLLFALTLPDFSGPGRAMQALGLLGLGVFTAVGTYIIVDLPLSTRAGRAAVWQAREVDDAKTFMYEMAVGGEAAFWKHDGDFAGSAGASPIAMSEFPHLMTHRGDMRRGWLHDH
ncbi:TIGR04222 domain-containing membrane protein [Actinoplanes sp. NPDC023714]|uniref:TIGR04222 domain-containing membrane protein n=1 Tax=Actinoplanes sp. NPDC023714 TaxID=3154322 RepID=UPI0033D7339B